jgi:hypothetical protein
MPGLVPGIHVLTARQQKDVDGRDEPGHDGETDQLENVQYIVGTKQKPGRGFGRVQNQGAADLAPGRSDQLQTSMRRKRQP